MCVHFETFEVPRPDGMSAPECLVEQVNADFHKDAGKDACLTEAWVQSAEMGRLMARLPTSWHRMAPWAPGRRGIREMCGISGAC